MDQEPASDIVRRLRCAAGHLSSVISMIEAGQPCEQILHQLNAVQAALQIAGVKLIECHAKSSQDIILNSASVEQRTEELHHLQSLFAIFVKKYSTKSEVNYE